MNPVTGHYCLIQYCPEPSRLEAANVGVLLFAPALNYLKALTSADNHRVQQFFGRAGQDLARLSTYKRGLEHRIDVERPVVQTLADLEKFIATRVNVLRITPPRPMLVTEPDKDLHDLFEELVADKAPAKKAKTLKATLGEILRDKFHAAGVDDRIEPDVRVRIEQFGKDETIPFGYQNGRFQLIKPVSFETEDFNKLLPKVSYHALEGELLFDQPDARRGPLQLTVVGQFPFQRTEHHDRIRRILETKHVRLFDAGKMDMLIQDISLNAKKLGDDRKTLNSVNG